MNKQLLLFLLSSFIFSLSKTDLYSQTPTICDPIVNTGMNHTIIFSNSTVTLNGADLPNGSFIIVVFDDGGTSICGGFTEWNGSNTSIAAFGDDNTTNGKDGFSTGESFEFKIELPDSSVIENSDITVAYNPVSGIFSNQGNYATNGISGIQSLIATTVIPPDCPSLGLNIGDSCDDGDDCTENDRIQPDCSCAGTFADDDNDGTCNAEDLCPGGPEPGTACDDGDACTENDMIQLDCNCAGTFADDDNDGTCNAEDVCPGGPEPGTACDDGDATTINDQINADCLCKGTPTICTGIGDADGDGVCSDVDCNDNDPQATGSIGAPCDDGDPCTINDKIQPGCGCAGTFQDSDNDGTCNAEDVCPNGPEPGTTCNDGDDCTENDVVQPDCSCAGTFADDDNDGTCNAEDVCPGGPEPGTACDDGDPNTIGETVQSDCSCDGGTAVVDCPALGLNIGMGCDDGNPNTTGDIVTSDCECTGTLPPCFGIGDADGDDVCDDVDNCPNTFNPNQADDDNDGTGNACETALTVTCPSNISVTAPVGQNSTTVNYDAPILSSNCTTGSLQVNLTAGLVSGASFPLSVTTVSFEATNGCGDASSCSFQIIVSPGTGTVDCNNINISGGSDFIMVDGLAAPINEVQVFTGDWAVKSMF